MDILRILSDSVSWSVVEQIKFMTQLRISAFVKTDTCSQEVNALRNVQVIQTPLSTKDHVFVLRDSKYLDRNVLGNSHAQRQMKS